MSREPRFFPATHHDCPTMINPAHEVRRALRARLHTTRIKGTRNENGHQDQGHPPGPQGLCREVAILVTRGKKASTAPPRQEETRKQRQTRSGPTPPHETTPKILWQALELSEHQAVSWLWGHYSCEASEHDSEFRAIPPEKQHPAWHRTRQRREPETCNLLTTKNPRNLPTKTTRQVLALSTFWCTGLGTSWVNIPALVHAARRPEGRIVLTTEESLLMVPSPDWKAPAT